MDYLQVFALSAAGMRIERTRVEAAAANLAHAHAAQDAARPSFQPLRVVARAAVPFQQVLEGVRPDLALPGADLVPMSAAMRLVREPGHPMANGDGMVAYPGVDPAAEMIALMSAMRAYEANLAAMNTARALALKTLEIGRGP